MVYFSTQEILRMHRNCCFEVQNWKTMSITAEISLLIFNGRFINF